MLFSLKLNELSTILITIAIFIIMPFNGANSKIIEQPSSLKWLCDNADLIVEGELIKVDTLEIEDTLNVRAVLNINFIISGEIQDSLVYCYFSASEGENPEPELILNKTLLAFLKSLDLQLGYTSLFHETGIKYLNSEAVKIYKAKIEEYFAIKSTGIYKGISLGVYNVTEWMLDCALDTIMRNEAAHDIFIGTGTSHSRLFSDEQYQRLYLAVLNETTLHNDDFYLLMALRGRIDNRIIPLLDKYISAYIVGDNYGEWVGSAIGLIAGVYHLDCDRQFVYPYLSAPTDSARTRIVLDFQEFISEFMSTKD